VTSANLVQTLAVIMRSFTGFQPIKKNRSVKQELEVIVIVTAGIVSQQLPEGTGVGHVKSSSAILSKGLPSQCSPIWNSYRHYYYCHVAQCICDCSCCSVAAEKRKLELAEKFQKLEQSGTLQQFIAKKKKKNLKTEQKTLPLR